MLCGETCLLVSWCAGDRCGMVGSAKDWGRCRGLCAEDREWPSTGRVLSGQAIERSGDAVCGLHHAQGDEEREFLSLASKTRYAGFLDWDSTLVAAVWWFGPQNHRDGFFVCASKASGLWFVGCATQTDGMMETALDRRRDLAACFTWKQVELGFPSLTSRLAEAQRRWCMWHHRGGRVDMKQKMAGPMASGATQCKLDKNTLH
jgi:hypothetical protein